MTEHWVTMLVLLPPTILLCLIAPARTRRARRAWRTIALIDAAALVDAFFNIRMRIHAAGMALAESEHLYGVRRDAQEIAIAAIVLVVCLTALVAIYRARTLGGPIVLATAATAGLVLLILVETISLHQIDTIFYQSMGPLLAVSWGWVACVIVTAGAALAARRRSARDRETIYRG